MSIASVGAQTALTQGLLDMKQTLLKLQTQLGTGKKAQSYADLGADVPMSLGLRARLSALSGYASTAQTVNLRLGLLQTTLTQIGGLGTDARQDAQKTAPAGDVTTAVGAQSRAASRLADVVGLLNTDAAGHYLFGGAATDRPPVQDAQLLLDGDGTHAGLRQIVAERRAADLGASGLGRLDVSALSGTSFTVGEDGAHPFGFKLAGATGPASGAITVSAPSGAPPSVGIGVASQPNGGDMVQLTLDLPDGSQETLQLTADASGQGGKGTFAIGATAGDTAANLRQAVVDALTDRASGALAAASALKAADDFFVSGGTAPKRVAGPPFDTATALTSGTSADTVAWYQGDTSSGNPRATATAQIDRGLVIGYGVKADETPFLRTLASIAALASDSYSSSDPASVTRYQALADRIGTRLDANGAASVTPIQMDVTSAQQVVGNAGQRQTTEKNTIQNLLDGVEGVSAEDVAASITAVQTQLEASYQTVAMLSKLSLVNYLPTS